MNFGEIREMRLVGAEFLEASANLYALVPFADKLIGLKNQVIATSNMKNRIILTHMHLNYYLVRGE